MKILATAFSHAGVLFMRLLAPLPLPVVRALGWALGWVLYALIAKRRKVVRKNLALCFPEHSAQYSYRLVPQIFIKFTQAWLDRSWLWHGSDAQLAQRLKVTGDVQALRETPRLVLFAPHFVGLDAGGVVITKNKLRPLCSIYSPQNDPVVDQWILQGRTRHGGLRLFARREGVREIAAAVQAGEALYLLPDMDFGAQGAEFVPFFGTLAATVTSLSRFSRLPKASVVTLLNRMTPEGYEVHFSSPWENFPTRDAAFDTLRMNQELEKLVREIPEQYYWVHKRFKTRPPGEPPIY
jgi:Kdo2-lipid IVA lauroyltransferase/acyltransferase